MDDRAGPPRAVRVTSWRWEPGDEEGRRGVPWLGVFFLLFGGLLLLQQFLPNADLAGSAVVLALGLAFLVAYATGRNVLSLYAGLILTALGLPALLQDAGFISGPGWGTLFLGLGFLVVAAFRASRRGGWGWQAIFGGVLVLVGGSQVAAHSLPGFPDVERLVWPVVLLVIGVLLLVRSGGTRRRWY
ncbi:MAG TPA: hypothetical protein VF763_03215 [Candidatus Limnocylindrales bacterium]